MTSFINTLVGRVLLSLALGTFISWGLSEMSFMFLQESSTREPHPVELVIPLGTAELVARGETPPSIPKDMQFTVGDTLVVKNEDVVDHQLGPVWAPPGTSASLLLDREANLAYACTFQPGRYFGLNISPRVTLVTRLKAIAFAGPPLGALIALYSVVLWPLNPKPRPNPS